MTDQNYTTFDDLTAELDNFIDQVKEIKSEIRSLQRKIDRTDEVEHVELRMCDHGHDDTATLRVNVYATEINYTLDDLIKERKCDVEFSPEGKGPVESKDTYRLCMREQIETSVEL